MTDERPPATGGVIRAGDVPLLQDGICRMWLPDRMPSREAVQFTISFGNAADRINLERLTEWMNASRRMRRSNDA